MSKIPIVLQLQSTECGLCCGNMILNYYGRQESIFDLRNEYEVGRDGLNLTNIKSLLNSRNLKSSIYKADYNGLKKVSTPFIALWDNNHFVVVEKIHNERISVVDPAKGKLKFSKEEFLTHFSSYILTSSPSKEFEPKKSSSNNSWKKVIFSVKNQKALIFFTLLFSFLVMLISLIIPNITQRLVDGALIDSLSNQFTFIVFFILLTAVLHFIFIYIRGFLIVKLNVFLTKKLTTDTFEHLLKLPYKFFDLRSSGDLLYRINSLTSLRDLISNTIVPGIVDFGMMATIFFYLINKSYLIASAALILVMINLFFLILVKKPLNVAVDNELHEHSKAQSTLVEILFSSMFVKMSGLENDFYNRWNKDFLKSVNSFKNSSNVQNLVTAVTSNFQVIAPLTILVVGIHQYLNQNLSLGEVVAIQTISSMFFSQSRTIFSAYTQIILASSYLKRIEDITSTPVEINDGIKTSPIHGDILLNNVSFSYTNTGNKVIKNINLQVLNGEKIALVGKSGSGKSSLAKLMAGLYTSNEGQIQYDDTNIEAFEKKSLLKQIGIVPQDNILFNRNIYENISMGQSSITHNEIEEAAKAAMIHDEIMEMPMNYYTELNGMGMNLSGGQRQRIAIARALVQKPKILILDEATSSLDQENEKKIMEYLNNINCTVIIVAHRLSTIKQADRIYFLNNGEIEEQGTHETLIKNRQQYYQLYSSKS